MYNYYKSTHYGFTLIEIIIVIIIIGIISIIALPKYIDFTNTAQTESTNSIAGSLSSANAENYAVRIQKNTNGSSVSNCTGVGALLMGSLPTGYSISSTSVPINATINCILTGPSSTSATFTATGIN